MGAHFPKVPMYFLFSLLSARISEIVVLPAWELTFREFFLRFPCFIFKHQNGKKMKFSCFSLFPFRARKGAERRREERSGAETRRERREEKTREENRREDLEI